MTSGAQVLPGSAQAGSAGKASPAAVQVTRSGEVRTGTLAPPALVWNRYQVPSTLIACGSGASPAYTGLVNVGADAGLSQPPRDRAATAAASSTNLTP